MTKVPCDKSSGNPVHNVSFLILFFCTVLSSFLINMLLHTVLVLFILMATLLFRGMYELSHLLLNVLF